METNTAANHLQATLVQAIARATALTEAEVAAQLGRPPKPEMGDYAFPCFAYAKKNKLPPPQAATQIAEAVKNDPAVKDLIAEASGAGPFMNLRIKPGELSASILKTVRAAGEAYGNSSEGAGKTIVIDYSGPNIAKPFHVGHLMSTAIGASLVRIYRALGYKVVGVNHLGDWGVQCGFQFLAWQRADPVEREKQLAERGLDWLAEQYVKINQEAKADPQLDKQARELFKRLESGDAELKALWERLRTATLVYMQKSYDRLGIKFESSDGEGFYEPMLKPMIADLLQRGIAVESEGAVVIPMDDGPPKEGKPKKPPFILLKSDEATIYGTRDLAAALYRKKTYDFARNLYVVDVRQANHFQQLFKALAKMGHAWAKDCIHVSFGMMKTVSGGQVEAMTTRGGKMVPLNELLDEMRDVVRDKVNEKNPELSAEKKEQVAEAVGVGAILFWIQARRRESGFIFDWDKATDPNGDTGPYLQYTHARAGSIRRKGALSALPQYAAEFNAAKAANATEPGALDRYFKSEERKPGATQRLFNEAGPLIASANLSLLVEPEETNVAKVLEGFPAVLKQAAADNEPSLISTYLLDLASALGRFLNRHRVIDSAPELKAARLALVDSVRLVLAKGLGLLGVSAPEEM